jgi:adenosine kinase
MAVAEVKAEEGIAGVLLGMGNPLLDISCNVDNEFLEKYKLKDGDIVLADEDQLPIYKEMQEKEGVQYIAGGATMNSIRVCQWMLQEEKATSYMGCIGKDENGEKLKAACKSAGLNTFFLEDETTPTGICAACIVDKERALCTNLAAANNYKVDHFKMAEQMAVLEKAKVVYSAGFFITVCPDAMEIAYKHCSEKPDKLYCLNLSAPFIMQVPPFKAALEKTLPFTDYLFGNETECVEFAKAWGWEETDVPSIAKKIGALPKEGSKPRTVVITQGRLPTVVCVNGELTEYPIMEIAADKVVDTNGAGDAYVGGFLSGLVKGQSVADCCKAGAYSAGVIVQRSGCTYPEKPDFMPAKTEA